MPTRSRLLVRYVTESTSKQVPNAGCHATTVRDGTCVDETEECFKNGSMRLQSA